MENGSGNSYHTHTYFICAAGVDIIGTAVYLIDFGNTISLMLHKTFSIRSPPIPRLTVLYCKMNFLHTVG